ncbi:MAG: FliH/SctL family protein [Candidatus Berkiella sp.]
MSSSNSSNNNLNRPWLLPEFGLLTHAQHSTKKKLKAKSVNLAKSVQSQQEEGYHQGYKKGYEAGLSQGSNEINQKLTQLSALICELTAYKNSLDEQFKNNMHHFAQMICEKIVMEKISLCESAIVNIINRALDVIDTESGLLKVFCNTHLLQKLPSQLQSKRIVFENDETMKDYAFRIESDRQFLDYNLHKALKTLIDESKDDLLGADS